MLMVLRTDFGAMADAGFKTEGSIVGIAGMEVAFESFGVGSPEVVTER